MFFYASVSEFQKILTLHYDTSVVELLFKKVANFVKNDLIKDNFLKACCK